MTLMKAIVCTQYGPPDVLQLKEVPTPAPKDHEVLVRVHATTVTSSDCIIRVSRVPVLMWIPARIALGLRKPRKSILGLELAGEIASNSLVPLASRRVELSVNETAQLRKPRGRVVPRAVQPRLRGCV